MTLFDAGIHPSLTGEWTNGREGLTFEELGNLLDSGLINGACAIGLPGVGGYKHSSFFQRASEIPGVVPVAAITENDPCRWIHELHEIRSVGFRAVKFHPRLLGLNARPELVENILGMCASSDLTLFYCTYATAAPGSLPRQDPLWSIVRAVATHPEAPIVLVHGGVHRLLEYAETFRYCPSVLIDLSFTLTRFVNSSVRKDISHVLQTLDQRVCLGSDTPDVPWSTWWERAETVKDEVDPARWHRIAQGNIREFLRC